MMPIQPKLVATYYTLAGRVYPGAADDSPYPFARRVAAAAEAGYHGIGVSGYDLRASIERDGLRGMRHILDDAGLCFFEIECLTDWFATGPERAASDEMRREWLRAAAEIGVQHLKVVGDLRKTGVTLEHMAAEFRTLCEQAATAGAYVSLEIFPEANVSTIESGRRLMALADVESLPGCGLLVDIWHITRPGIDYAEIAALPKSYIAHVELDDADKHMIGSYFEDTTYRRRVPGEGCFNIGAFLAAVGKTGYAGPIGIEILSEEMRGLSPEDAARKSFDASIACFAS